MGATGVGKSSVRRSLLLFEICTKPREQFIKNITSALNTLVENIRKKGSGDYQVDKIFTKEPIVINRP